MTMIEQGRCVGIGNAILDAKLYGNIPVLPDKSELDMFLSSEKHLLLGAGGVTANILAALAGTSSGIRTRLLGCVGDDYSGGVYQSQTDKRLGPLQIHPTKSTGIVALVIDENGNNIQKAFTIGAASEVKVTKEEQSDENALFVTDLLALRSPDMVAESEKIVDSLPANQGIFAVNLAGMNPFIDEREAMISILIGFKQAPDLIFGNRDEFEYLLQTSVTESHEELLRAFPKSRMVVMTEGKNGAVVRFEDQEILVPSYAVPDELVVDTTGAGDCFEGAFLSALYERPYKDWNARDVSKAAQVAAYAASLIVQSKQSRLSPLESGFVREKMQMI